MGLHKDHILYMHKHGSVSGHLTYGCVMMNSQCESVPRARVTNAAFKKAFKLHDLWRKGDPKGRRMEFIGRDLRGVEFDSMDLTDVIITECDIRCCEHMRGVNFTGANLSWNDFTGSDMHGCNFTRADISHSKFNCTSLRFCKFIGCDMTHTLVLGCDARWSEWDKPIIVNSAWVNVNLWGVNMSECHIQKLGGKSQLTRAGLFIWLGQKIGQHKDCPCCPNWRKWNRLHEDERGSLMMTPAS